MTALTAVTSVISAVPGDPTPGVYPDPTTVGPGLLGFIVLFLFAVACVLLFRSMVGHLRKVRYSPDPAKDGDLDAAPDAPEIVEK